MKMLLFFFFLLTFPLGCCFAQNVESEILNWISWNKISGSKLIEVDTVTIQINTRSGDNDADIEIPYTKKDKLSIGDAWIEDAHGNVVRRLKKDDIKDRNVISGYSLYQDDFVKTFQLKYNVYPYRIVYSYQITSSDFFSLFSWRPQYGKQQNIHQFRITVEVPQDYPIKYSQKITGEPEIIQGTTSVRYVWKGSYKSTKKEIEADVSGKLPEIKVVPLKFKYGEKGTWESWTTFGDWTALLNKGLDVLTPDETQKIDRLLSGVTDRKEKMHILYKYLQDYTRYVNVKIDIGGFKPYPASYVCENKYGDCKALSNYMKSMLAYAGIPSYYTLIRAGGRTEDVDKSFPYQVFNHVIVTVPLESDTIFLECTSKNTPFGYLGTFTQNRDAFLIIAGDSRFIHTPELTNEGVLCKRIIRTNETDNAEIEMTYRGEEYEEMTFLHRETELMDKYVRTHLLSDISSNIYTWELSGSGNEKPEIGLKARVKLQNPIKKYGNNLVLPNFPYDLPMFETPEKRTQNVRIYFPIFRQDSIYYALNNNLKGGKLPDPVEIQTKYGSYRVKWALINDNTILITKGLLVNSGIYTIDKYPDFYHFIATVKNEEKKSIYLEIK